MVWRRHGMVMLCCVALQIDCRLESVGPVTDHTPIHATTSLAAAQASNRFGFDLYANLCVRDENLIVSPISAALALAMTSAGARGQTLAEMSHVLHVDTLGDAHGAFADLLGSLPLTKQTNAEEFALPTLSPDAPRQPAPAQLHVANRVWGRKGFTYREDFLSLLRDRYRAPLGEEDFSAPETARAHINDWVGEHTQNRIRDLLPPDSIHGLSSLILTDAVYFKALWSSPFEARTTRDEDFREPSGNLRVPMMRQMTDFPYAEFENLQIVELPYLGQVSMIVVLPEDDDGLGDVERQVGLHFDQWVAALARRPVDLWLPKWKVTQFFLLDKALQTLGMSLAYTRQADFSGMTDMPMLDPGKFHIETVLQKAFVETNELGTEAAAATAVLMAHAISQEIDVNPPKPVVFHADHPFLYVIRERRTGAILFAGRVVKPSESPI